MRTKSWAAIRAQGDSKNASELTPTRGLAFRRREFLGGAGGAAAVGRLALGGAAAAVAGMSARAPAASDETVLAPSTGEERQRESFKIRLGAAKQELGRPTVDHPTNGDEECFPNRIGNFSKTLPHNELGEVDPAAYDALLRALEAGDFELMEQVPRAGGRFTNPLGGLAFALEGPDTAAVGLNPPPSIASQEWAADLVELYWMALLCDVPFSEYDSHPLAREAREDLVQFKGYRGPQDPSRRGLRASDLFRADYPGVTDGPMVSQFLLQPFFYDAIPIAAPIETSRPGAEFITTYDEWLNSQNGFPGDSMPPALPLDPSLRYPRNARDLAEIAASDVVNSPYFRAILVMMDAFGIPPDGANPYNDSVRQTGFATFGVAHLVDLIGKAPKAERHAYFQKWQVHRFLRPEAGGGRVHNVLTGRADYPLHGDLVHSSVWAQIFEHNQVINKDRLGLDQGTYLLPQQSRSGSPTNPSFTSGHAFSAGVCVTMLKVWVQEDVPFPDPVQPTLDGLDLVPYDGQALTLGGELNKLAHNLTWGRSMGGVHWRADNVEGLRQGEQVAIRLLEEEMAIYPERFDGFTLTKFDGETITLSPADERAF